MGTIDLLSGVITPIVTNLVNPGGLVFVDTSRREHEEERFCRDRE